MIIKNFKKLTLTFLIFTSIPSFAVDKVIDGGAGTNSLTINYSGISSLSNFDISTSGDSIILTDPSSNAISFRLIKNLTVGDYTYINVQTDRGGSSIESHKAYWNATEKALYLYDGSNLPSDIWKTSETNDVLVGLTQSMNVVVTGSAGTNYFNLNVDRSGSGSYTGNWTMDLKGGNDSIGSAKLKDADSIDMGSGDDTVYVMLSGSNGTPALGSANITKLDGGTGTDTLAFTESTVAAGSTLTLTTANATNFENLIGSNAVETLNGDNNANTIKGDGGADTINGNGGNDILVASGSTLAGADSATTNDNLYGGSGNDTLNGTAGDNILDGGTGADTIYSGGGSDTIIIRSGDGGSSIEDADVITDFSDTNDIIGLSGLNFSDVTPKQGSGSYANHVIVQENSSGDFLLIIQNQSIDNIDDYDFSAI